VALEDLSELGAAFAIDGELLAAVTYGTGHINDTFAASYRMRGGGRRRFIHQRINREVFRDPAALMDNVARVTRHVRAKLEAEGVAGIDRRVLSLVPARDGRDFLVDGRGEYWRTYVFIEGATTFDVVETPEQAGEVARAFGAFQQQLADLPPPPLAETIPGFHDTPSRLQAMRDAVAGDAADRTAGAAGEIRRLEAYAPLAGALLAPVSRGAVPLRVAHNDTKINNVLIDEATGEALCVIDLDTVMPGLALDDFGDLVRTSVCFAKEDDRDLARARVQRPLFQALVRGYLAAAGSLLTPAELGHLVTAGRLMTYECALRFLTDHLCGDVYFRVHHEGHNLDRARVQLALLDSLTEREDELQAIVADEAPELVGG
jgi:Ser/Thr protein kinase RdoA (MazF antagonist)